MGQREKNIEKRLFCECRCSKKVKTAGSGGTLPQFLSNPKCNLLAKFIFT